MLRRYFWSKRDSSTQWNAVQEDSWSEIINPSAVFYVRWSAWALHILVGPTMSSADSRDDYIGFKAERAEAQRDPRLAWIQNQDSNSNLSTQLQAIVRLARTWENNLKEFGFPWGSDAGTLASWIHGGARAVKSCRRTKAEFCKTNWRQEGGLWIVRRTLERKQWTWGKKV